MHEVERQAHIVELLDYKNFVSIQDIADVTLASESTIRRDIVAMDQLHLLKRVRGGAKGIGKHKVPKVQDRPFSENIGKNRAEKMAIAWEAAKLCRDGDSIILSGGTTIYQMCPFLVDKNLQILTNSFPVAAYLIAHSQCTVTVPGGIVYREQDIILSPHAGQQEERFHASRMFIGAAAIKKSGVLETNPLITQSVQRLITCADELIVCADADKFSRSASLVLAPLDKISRIITDARVSEQILADFQTEKGIIRVAKEMEKYVDLIKANP